MANTFHVSLNVRSIPDAIARYRKILGVEPAKVREDYAKFELADPPIILSLNLGGVPGSVGHLGIRFPESAAVAKELRRAEADALDPFRQDGVTCCYATADKFWVNDADGVAWEMYSVLADAEPERAPEQQSAASGCGCSA
jgi:catechol 2,3-dioxygenase-like lactoylglutathione lyase family enzyme